MTQLRRLARLQYGDALATETRLEGEVPVMSSGGVTGRHSHPNTLAPAIIIGRKGSYGSIHWTDVPAFVIDTAYYVDSRSTDCDLRWLYYALQAVDLRGTSQDVGVPGLSRSAVYDLHLPALPELEEQRRVAAYLDGEVLLIDRALALRERQMSLLRERHLSWIEDVFVSRQRDEPKRPLAWLCDPKRPIQYGIVLPGPNHEGGVPIIKGGDVAAGRLSPELLQRTTAAIDAQYSRSRVREGDLVIAIRGSFGEVQKVPASLNGANLTQDSARIAPQTADLDWLAAVLETPTLQSQMQQRATGAMVKGLNIFELRRLSVPVPPEARQLELGRTVRDEAERLQRAYELLATGTTLLTQRKQALIAAAVTGQLDVTTARSVA